MQCVIDKCYLRWITYLIILVNTVCMATAVSFRTDGNITLTRYNAITGETFLAQGNVIVRLSNDLVQTGRYEVGKKVENTECDNPFEPCPEVQNQVTILEIVHSNEETNLLFVCLKLENDYCYFIDPLTSILTEVEFDVHHDFFNSFSITSPISFLLETNKRSSVLTKQLALAHSIDLKTRHRSDTLQHFAVFSLLQIAFNSSTGVAPIVSLLTQFKLHVNHAFKVIYGFEINHAVYFIVRYSNPHDHAEDSVVQIKPTDNSAQLLETRIKCAEHFVTKQAGIVLDDSETVLYFLYSGQPDDTQKVICEVDIPDLEAHFESIRVDCIEKNKGSYPNWLNLSRSAKPQGPCSKQVYAYLRM